MPLIHTVVLLACLATFSACATTIPNRLPLGDSFPSVLGKDLRDVERQIPDEFAGSPLLVLVGFVQNAQFDIDRWLIGVSQVNLPIKVVELPTIKGMSARRMGRRASPSFSHMSQMDASGTAMPSIFCSASCRCMGRPPKKR